jgi:hypothetical protein
MRRRGSTLPVRVIAGLLTGLLLAIVAVSLSAETAVHSPVYYDMAKEVTISGTVSSVITKPAGGMMWGPHLMVTTASGEVDASLGRWAMQGKSALPVAAGQQVEVTGVMKTLNHKQVFIARTVKVGGQIHTVRNERGLELSPSAHERASQKSGQKGGVL